MGNKLGKRRYVVEDKYTRPQGLYQNMDVDRKKLRKLILDSKLAPCYPGDEESTLDLEECPICFLYYPSLNRSRCCMKGICTECFLQMNQQNSACSIPCPFCKTSNYGVEYRGMRTKEERGLEEMEEQKVLEAKIRIQQRERQDEEERLRKKQSRITVPGEAETCEIQSSSIPEPSFGYAVQRGEENVSWEVPCSSAVNWASRSRQNRYEDLAMDLESAMNSEALWHNIQIQPTEAMIPACSSSVDLPSHTPVPDFFYPRPSSGPATQAHQLYWPAHWPAARGPDSWSFSDGCYSTGAVTGFRLPETLQEQMMLAMAEARARAGGAAWM